MTEHPNLSPEINANLAQTERDGGVFTKDVLPGSTVRVQTLNTLYTLVNHGSYWSAFGGKHIPEPTRIGVNGSTFGGSMIKTGFIGPGMHLELSIWGWEHGRGPLTTSPIQSIKVVLPKGTDPYAYLAEVMFNCRGEECRQQAKAFTYGANYNVRAELLRVYAGLDTERVQQILNLLQVTELEEFPRDA